MSDGPEIRVTATDEASPVLKQVSDSVKGVGDAAPAAASVYSGGINEIVDHSTRGSFAMKGFHFAAHEAFAEMGVGGRMARALGTETEHLAGSLGMVASVMGGVAMAGVIGYQMYEHFTRSSEAAKQAQEAQARSLTSTVDSIYQWTDKTKAQTKAIQDLEKAEISEWLTRTAIERNKEVEKLQKERQALIDLAESRKNSTNLLLMGTELGDKAIVVGEKQGTSLDDLATKTKTYETNLAKFNLTYADYEARVNTPPTPKPDKSGADKSEMSKWDAELSAQRLVFEKEKDQQDEFQKWSLSQDLAFWQTKANGRKGSEEDRAAAARKANDTERQMIDQRNQEELGAMKMTLELYRKNGMERVEMAQEIEKKQAQVYGVGSMQHQAAIKEREQAEKDFGAEVGKMWDAIAERERLAERHSIDMKKEELNTKVALGQTTRQEELAQLIAFENESWRTQQKDLETEKQGLDGSYAAYQQWLTKKTQLYQKHELDIQKLRNQGVIAEQQELRNALQPMTSAFQTSLNGMMMGTQTFAATMRNMFRNIAMSFLQDLVMTNLKNWILGENQKTAASVIFSAIRKTISTGEAATEAATETERTTAAIILAKTNATGEIPAYTGIAMMEAASSVASVPYIGPLLAEAAAESMQMLGLDAMAMAAFHVGGVASSPSGYEFPAMIEPGERILTNEQNSTFGRLENFLNNGSQGNSSTIHLHGSPSDKVSLADVAKLVFQVQRDGHNLKAKFA